MTKKNYHTIVIATILVCIVLVSIWIYKSTTTPGQYDDFAQCITDSGATFYGAFWCPHCQNQKQMFGKSAKLLPYIECSTTDGKGQLSICTDVGVSSYPTWVFTNGTVSTGEVSFEELASKTNCSITQ